ncbi:MAG: hypothetical protein RLZZ600_937 [Actinomycetota bacterium]
MLAVSGIVALALVVTPSVAKADDLTSCNSMIVNGDYQTPDISGQDWTGVTDGTDGLGWHTADSTHFIEIWNGIAQSWVGREPGDQISEVQYSDIAYVWQDIATTPGDTLDISLEHRGRYGQDHLLINAGPVDGPMTMVVDADDPNDGWYTHSGTYVVPAGQTTTRIQLDPVTYGATGSLIDNVVVTSEGCTSGVDNTGLVNLSEGASNELVDTAGSPDSTSLLASGAFVLLASGVAILRLRRIRLRSSGR